MVIAAMFVRQSPASKPFSSRPAIILHLNGNHLPNHQICGPKIRVVFRWMASLNITNLQGLIYCRNSGLHKKKSLREFIFLQDTHDSVVKYIGIYHSLFYRCAFSPTTQYKTISFFFGLRHLGVSLDGLKWRMGPNKLLALFQHLISI